MHQNRRQVTYVYGSLTLSILTITQRHGDDGVVSSKCSVGNGRVRDEGNGAATRSPVCLQSLPPDIQRYQHDGWA